MTERTSPAVYRLHSTLEVPLDAVYEYFEDPDLPADIADVELTRRNNTLLINSVATDEGIGKYTPTAQLKATLSEKRVEQSPPQSSGLQFNSGGETADEPPSELVKYAGFKGKDEEVIVHTALRYPMFEILCDLAHLADRGSLSAIVEVDGELDAILIVDGQARSASVKVIEDPEEHPTVGVDWRNNEYIS